MMYFMLFLACLGRKLNAKLHVIKGQMNFDFFSHTLKTLKEISEIVWVYEWWFYYFKNIIRQHNKIFKLPLKTKLI
jgi:hypothetical protein